MKKIILSLAVIGTILNFSCSDKKGEKTLKENKKEEKAGLDLKFIDKTVKPQDDFYNYVNGIWMKNTKIPDDRSRWGSFGELRKNTDESTIKILDEAIKNNEYPEGSDQAKAISYYKSILDTNTRDKQGIEPIKKYLEKIDKINTRNDVLKYMIETEPILSSNFLGVSVDADMKNSNKNSLYLFAVGNGLPERDYYVNNSEDAKKIREQYKKHIARMLKFINYNKKEAVDIANRILRLETILAKAKMTKEELRKPENRYNPVSLTELNDLLSQFKIKNYLESFGIKKIDTVVITDKNYFKEINKIFKDASLSDIKDLFKWNLLRTSAGELSTEISDANWEFYGKILNGQKQRRPIKERALGTVNWSIGEAVGKVYVDKLFPPEAKKKAKEMVNYLQKAYKKRISQLNWMSDETKKKAIEKVEKLTIKIGYPDKWKDYSNLEVKSPENGGNYFSNSLAVSKWNFEKQIDKLNKPVDKTEWGMAPQIVNAYYNPSYNEIVFPAAILQPPFYNYKADEAVNYGGIGAVIGHEISHGFDDQGAKYNAEGNFENWWTKKDFDNFNKLVKKLANQFSKIEVLPGVFVNGVFTSGENIGDLGGVNAAYTALQLYYKDHNKPNKIQGFTPEQRFFISWAKIWRTKSREEALKQQIKLDPHSPGQIRASQPLKNVDAFYKAFDVKKENKMYLPIEERVKIW